ncbi:lysozyme inhibitor LprI family protein [Massilia consociata]|uniref:Lysozyme inhibitor LprI family protein n=1 Tax=Massilia consociata TaxID=760117 RepID=A0ABV6FG71_9BURK
MRALLSFFAPFFFAVLCTGARAQVSGAAHERECARLAPLAYPAAHQPGPAQQAGLAQCSATDAYYGNGSPADYRRARHCAFLAKPDDQPFRMDRGILMMLYANGQGVARDYPLARKAACEAGGAPAEIEARLAHLGRMASGEAGARPKIDICDDITSGYMGGLCAAIASDLRARETGAMFARLTASWTAPEKAALARLERAAKSFIEERSGLEVDMTGTARTAFYIEERDSQWEAFRASLAAFEGGALPRHTAAEHALADARLNTVYRALMAMPEPVLHDGTIRNEGIRHVQRRWLAYRDAWVAFGRVKYPQVPALAWNTYFTLQRTRMLEELAAWRN